VFARHGTWFCPPKDARIYGVLCRFTAIFFRTLKKIAKIGRMKYNKRINWRGGRKDGE
jgi:hypothetical protein